MLSLGVQLIAVAKRMFGAAKMAGNPDLPIPHQYVSNTAFELHTNKGQMHRSIFVLPNKLELAAAMMAARADERAKDRWTNEGGATGGDR